MTEMQKYNEISSIFFFFYISLCVLANQMWEIGYEKGSNTGQVLMESFINAKHGMEGWKKNVYAQIQE